MFNSQQWAIKYDYDLNSNLIAKTDSRVNSLGQLLQVSYAYDVLNRVTTRSYSNDPAGTPMVTYTYQGSSTYYAGGAANDATNRIQYAAQGAVSVMKMGNGLWEHTNFNPRLQPTQIGLGTTNGSRPVGQGAPRLPAFR